MAGATQNGKGYEWAIARAFSRKLNVPIRDDQPAAVAKASFGALEPELRARFDLSAEVGIAHVLERENSKITQHTPRQVHLMSDAAGKAGDVRDVVLTSGEVIFGVSCKSNHRAYKHPRLSGQIDWVSSWGINSRGASEEYWGVVRPLFEELDRLKIESSGTALFRDLENLHGDFYMPILSAFETELSNQVSQVGSQAVAEAIASYVIGRKDFYKFVTTPRELLIQTYNFNGTLAGPKSMMPSQVLAVDRLEGSQFSMNLRLDRGYVFNFRLHSASSRIEPSLKFDVQAIGLPASEIRQTFMSLDGKE